jgi:WD40 repeat protein
MPLTLVALSFPTIGYGDSGSIWINQWFRSNDSDKHHVATQVAKLHETGNIYGVDFSHDGKYLAAIPYGQDPLNIWDWQSGRIVHALEKAHGANIVNITEAIRYSPDGRLLATCHSRAKGEIVARIWNTSTWEIAHDISDPKGGGSCKAIGFTPDGKSLIQVLDQDFTKPGDNIIIYNTDTWGPVWGLRTTAGSERSSWATSPIGFEPSSLAISPDGKLIALGGRLRDVSPAANNEELFRREAQKQPQIAIVDMAQRKIVRTIQGMWATHLAWSPDGAHIAAVGGTPSGSEQIRIFDAQSGKVVASEAYELAQLIRYTPDGKYLIESSYSSLRIWDGQHRELLREIPDDSKEHAQSIAVSQDGRYFAAAIYTKIFIWQLK